MCRGAIPSIACEALHLLRSFGIMTLWQEQALLRSLCVDYAKRMPGNVLHKRIVRVKGISNLPSIMEQL